MDCGLKLRICPAAAKVYFRLEKKETHKIAPAIKKSKNQWKLINKKKLILKIPNLFYVISSVVLVSCICYKLYYP